MGGESLAQSAVSNPEPCFVHASSPLIRCHAQVSVLPARPPPDRHTVADEAVADGIHADVETLADLLERQPGLVEGESFVERIVHAAVAALDTSATDGVEHRGSVHSEVTGYPSDRGARFVAGEQFAHFGFGQAVLFLAERWDGSTGRSITPATSEDALQTGHDVRVGIASHHLHTRSAHLQRQAGHVRERQVQTMPGTLGGRCAGGGFAGWLSGWRCCSSS
jgi:hypothetical protein